VACLLYRSPIPAPDTAVSRKSATPNFEQALDELQKLVEKMESGEQTLEQALESFQRGIELARACQTSLKNAEQRVEQLTRKNGAESLEPFEPPADE
jgi:exodeoxyribonuclease VII small subunit